MDHLAALLRPYVTHEERVLSSGETTDWYLDARQLTYGRPDVVGMMLANVIESHNIKFDAVGGPGFGAIAMAVSVAAYYGDKRSFALRGNAKQHGLGGQLVGPLQEGDRTLIVDDVVTTGNSMLAAASVVDYIGAKPIAALCLLNRGWNVSSFDFGSHKVPLISILQPQDLLSKENK